MGGYSGLFGGPNVKTKVLMSKSDEEESELEF